MSYRPISHRFSSRMAPPRRRSFVLVRMDRSWAGCRTAFTATSERLVAMTKTGRPVVVTAASVQAATVLDFAAYGRYARPARIAVTGKCGSTKRDTNCNQDSSQARRSVRRQHFAAPIFLPGSEKPPAPVDALHANEGMSIHSGDCRSPSATNPVQLGAHAARRGCFPGDEEVRALEPKASDWATRSSIKASMLR